MRARPLTAEGSAALDAVLEPGVWQRAGMTGMPSGVSMSEALARIGSPDSLDGEALRVLITAAERGMLAGWATLRKNAEGAHG